MVDALLQGGADKNSRTKTGLSAMQSAAQDGHVEVVWRLVERGADFASRTNENMSLPLAAVYSGDIKTTKLALDINGSDGINSFTTDGVSPLIVACLMNKPDLVKTLVENGGDVNATGAEGYTALHAAAAKDYKEIVIFLLGHGADPNAQDMYFGTPYTRAVENMAEVRKQLLDHGGDVSIESAYGRTPVTFFDSIGVLEGELQAISKRPAPASPVETRQRQIRRLKALLQKALQADGTSQIKRWDFELIGHLIGFLGNPDDARIAFEQ
ncbi:Ankyrin-2 [Fusarium oxysporum f. sp. rapae]|uniref:Ankyrin-2 n=1 Tax=Fusarium oxysporum f. sp. rapae TaxID=485398 RepID=A0A8J5NJT1_FUSOX|nr:Ankyrin-2 [Fusarium oxysporum f. sp. rapae]